MRRCPHCRRPIQHERVGVFLPPRKCEIFDAVRKRAGISTGELASKLGISPYSVRAHILQLNDLLAGTDYRVHGRTGHGYRLAKLPPRG